jgi:glycolate oxidase
MVDIQEILEKEGIKTYLDDKYLYDETPEFVRVEPSRDIVVVKPETTEEVSRIMKIASSRRIKVFIRGGGTGLSCGAVPTESGIVLSTEKMKEIEIDSENFCAVCGAGVTLGELIKKAESCGLSFPPHPGSEEATVGGMVSTNAGGVRAMKYGVMRNYVLGIVAVLPDGEIIRFGGKLIKNNAGYNLMHLLIGSEGTLAVITEITVRLLPPMQKTATLAIPFKSVDGAIQAVVEILRAGLMPLALEYIEKDAIEIGEGVSGRRWPPRDRANLMVIIEAGSENELIDQAEKIEKICKGFGASDIFLATGVREQRDLLMVRSLIYEGIKRDVLEILDVSVPVAAIPEYIKKCNEVAERMGFRVINYGHAGDGNIHQHPLKGKFKPEEYDNLKKEFFRIAKSLGGTITGEHGVGAVKKKELRELLPETEYDLMVRIKRAFDPLNILNPGKVLDI